MKEKVYLCAAKAIFHSKCNMQHNNMKMKNKTLTLLAAVLVVVAGFIASCSKEDSNDDVRPPVRDEGLDLKLGGWTVGSNAYASYIPSDGDSLVIFATKTDNSSCILVYSSPTWGVATLLNVKIEKNDTAYLFSKPVTATLRDDRSAWDFSIAPIDTFYMPNRNPQAEELAVKPYPVTLTSGYLTIETPHRWQFDFDAYLVPRSNHIQHVSFRSGRIPAMH